ncbi:MAG: prepilin peptidase [Bdellovibrionales bacterium]|nr:prepilin peptidase [Bdellovibrionales bacterium]
MDPLIIIFLFFFGAIIGSFLTVCIYRIPLGREDIREEIIESGQEIPIPDSIQNQGNLGIGFPKRSFCPECGGQLAWYHNVPLFSWMLLGGKCAFCKCKIPFRYFLVELLTASAALLSYFYYGMSVEAFLLFVFLSSLIIMSFIDIDYYILPDIFTISGTVIGLLIATVNQFFPLLGRPFSAGLIDAFLGILAGGGVLYFVSEVYFRLRKVEGLGMGDVKLLAMIGALFGPEAAVYTIMVGSIIGTVFGVAIIIFKGKDLSYHLPFGPYLSVAVVLYLFTGFEIVVKFTESIQYLINLI